VKHSKLIAIVGDFNVLAVACEIIKSRFGNMTYTAESGMLNSSSYESIKKVARKVLNSCFKFKSVRRVEIYRPSKKSLITGNFRDRIVQQAISMVLEQIFEPRFFKTSHGFRVAKGCHSALKQIHREWLGISWFLELDVYKHFDVINRCRLIHILSEDIDDSRFLNLISQLFDAGVVGWSMKTYLWSIGLFKNCVVSPILCNIYLHKLDLEVCRIQKKWNVYGNTFSFNKNQGVSSSRRTKVFASLSMRKCVGILKQRNSDAHKIGLICKG
jgi:retron-type reverse transcriptase